MVVSFSLEVLTTSTGSTVKTQIDGVITSLVTNSGFNVKEITVDQGKTTHDRR